MAALNTGDRTEHQLQTQSYESTVDDPMDVDDVELRVDFEVLTDDHETSFVQGPSCRNRYRKTIRGSVSQIPHQSGAILQNHIMMTGIFAIELRLYRGIDGTEPFIYHSNIPIDRATCQQKLVLWKEVMGGSAL